MGVCGGERQATKGSTGKCRDTNEQVVVVGVEVVDEVTVCLCSNDVAWMWSVGVMGVHGLALSMSDDTESCESDRPVKDSELVVSTWIGGGRRLFTRPRRLVSGNSVSFVCITSSTTGTG